MQACHDCHTLYEPWIVAIRICPVCLRAKLFTEELSSVDVGVDVGVEPFP